MTRKADYFPYERFESLVALISPSHLRESDLLCEAYGTGFCTDAELQDYVLTHLYNYSGQLLSLEPFRIEFYSFLSRVYF
ncbi:hypothetical protein AV530_012649 [Patagioenas fasciata monilis]|uniref:Uncharacterized protein n=1 Tax=Patagioenas fasciata monilis TaxID=372326 RepID=A0A1V4JBN0_PATFA|nr:hypothetical protein AV530_012649 [Patagioenas fasciata monilis]